MVLKYCVPAEFQQKKASCFRNAGYLHIFHHTIFKQLLQGNEKFIHYTI